MDVEFLTIHVIHIYIWAHTYIYDMVNSAEVYYIKREQITTLYYNNIIYLSKYNMIYAVHIIYIYICTMHCSNRPIAGYLVCATVSILHFDYNACLQVLQYYRIYYTCIPTKWRILLMWFVYLCAIIIATICTRSSVKTSWFIKIYIYYIHALPNIIIISLFTRLSHLQHTLHRCA